MSSEGEKWCHFLMDQNTPVDVPASFIEGYQPDMELKKNTVYNVFWSPNDEDTPESILQSDQGPIAHINDLPKKPSVPITGWYPSILMAIADSYEDLEDYLEKKRIGRPTAKVIAEVSSCKSNKANDKSAAGSSSVKKSKDRHSKKLDKGPVNCSKNTKSKIKLLAARRQNILLVMKSFQKVNNKSSATSAEDKPNKIIIQENKSVTPNKDKICDKQTEVCQVNTTNADSSEENIKMTGETDLQNSAAVIMNVDSEEAKAVTILQNSATMERSKNEETKADVKKIQPLQKNGVRVISEECDTGGTTTSDDDFDMKSDTSDVPIAVYQSLKEKCDKYGKECMSYEAVVCSLKKKLKEYKEEAKENYLKFLKLRKKYEAVAELNGNLQLELAEMKRIQKLSTMRASSQMNPKDLSSSSPEQVDRSKVFDDKLKSHPLKSFTGPKKIEKVGEKSLSADKNIPRTNEKDVENIDGANECEPVLVSPGQVNIETEDIEMDYSLDSAEKSPTIRTPNLPHAKQLVDQQKDKAFDSSVSPQSLVIKKNSEPKVKDAPKRKRCVTTQDNFCLLSEEELRKKLQEPSFAFSPKQVDQLISLFKKKPGPNFDSKFTKKASSLLWTDKELWNRSAFGVGSTKREYQARPECTPEKKDYLQDILHLRIVKETATSSPEEARKRLEKVPSIISSKISQLRRHAEPASPIKTDGDGSAREIANDDN